MSYCMSKAKLYAALFSAINPGDYFEKIERKSKASGPIDQIIVRLTVETRDRILPSLMTMQISVEHGYADGYGFDV